MLAVAEGADAIAFLDADNYFDSDHVAVCLAAAAAAPDIDFVVAHMRIELPDGTPVQCQLEPVEEHIDTNCFFLLPGAFAASPSWALQPKPYSPVGDRLFLQHLKSLGLSYVVCPKTTVNYVSTWAVHYQIAGQAVPVEAKENWTSDPIYDWWDGLTERQKVFARRQTGLPFLDCKRPGNSQS